ncbi:hypothetical protein ABVT39_014114 [Epinephelus coioides]
MIFLNIVVTFDPHLMQEETVYIKYPSKVNPERYRCDADISGVISNLAKGNFTMTARLMLQHENLIDALKPAMETVIDKECQRLCHQREGFMLWMSSPEELRNFSLHSLRKDLERMAPFMFSLICTISGMQHNHACAAAAIALRGRENRLSAFSYYINSVLQYGGAKKSYYINSVLQYGGAKKSVFERLCKMGITTTHSRAVLKQYTMSTLCGEELQKIKAQKESRSTTTAQESIGQPTTPHLSFQCELSESLMSDLGIGLLDINDDDDITPTLLMSPPQLYAPPVVCEEGDTAAPTLLKSPPQPSAPPVVCEEGDTAAPTLLISPPQASAPPVVCEDGDTAAPTLLMSPPQASAPPVVCEEGDTAAPTLQTSTLQHTIPPTYSVIFDNLDLFVHVHHQTTDNPSKSIHWTHHVVVEDRIPLHHLSDEKPVTNLENCDLSNSLPNVETQKVLRRDFIVLASRIISKHLAAFKPFSSVVVHHIPHQYSDHMSKPSTSHPMGLLLKNENVTGDLVQILRHIQKEYVPNTPDGSPILVGGVRLTEADSRNVQWAFANGASKTDRLEDLLFMFLDWHAVRNLYEVYHSIFFKEVSARDHGTLCSNMNRMKCSNAKAGPHKAYNPYKEVVKKDTAALLLAATMEQLGLKNAHGKENKILI